MGTKKNGQNGQNLESVETIDTIQPQPESKLLKAFNELKEENEKLKSSRALPLDFDQAAELFRKKAKILDEIAHLEHIKAQVREINLEPDRDNNFDAKYYSLNLSYGSREPFFKVSNIMVISEFIDFVFVRLSAKIDELKAEVQQL